MPSPERSPEQSKESPYVPLSRVPARDYWIGSEYRGLYYSQLKINISVLEAIARTANLPPIVIAHEAWTPPVQKEPEKVGNQNGELLLGQKKTVFRKKDEDKTSSFKYSSIEVLPETIKPNKRDIAIGWMIKLNTRKMDDDFSKKNPLALETQRSHHILHTLDAEMRSSIVRIAMMEVLNRRTHDLDGILGPVLQLLNLYDSFDLNARLLNSEVYISTSQNILWFLFNGTNRFSGRPWQDGIGFSNNEMRVPNLWREYNFPDRYQEELKRSHFLKNRVITNFVPGGFVFNPVYIAAFESYLRHPSPLFSLA